MSEIWRPSVTVAAVIERGGRFLLVEERVDGRSVLNQPAGHLDRGESLLAACRREVLEETAHRFEPSGLVGIYRWHYAAREVTFLRFCFSGVVDSVEKFARGASQADDITLLFIRYRAASQTAESVG